MWVGDEFDLLVSLPILDEYTRILNHIGGQLDRTLVDTWRRVLIAKVLLVAHFSSGITRSRDARDDMFLECMVAGEGDYLVTGDKDLLVLAGESSFPIVTPRVFLKRWSECSMASFVIGFDTSALVAINGECLHQCLNRLPDTIPCITTGILLELGDKRTRAVKTCRKIRSYNWQCLKELPAIIAEEVKQYSNPGLIDLFMSSEGNFACHQAINNLAENHVMPDYERKRLNRSERARRWWQDVGRAAAGGMADPICLSLIDQCAEQRFVHRLGHGPSNDEPREFSSAYSAYKDMPFSGLPPSFKAISRFEAMKSILPQPLSKQKKMTVRLDHSEGVEEIKMDANTLDDMRHFLAPLPYMDCMITCDNAMLRLLGFFYPNLQRKILFLNRRSHHPAPDSP